MTRPPRPCARRRRPPVAQQLWGALLCAGLTLLTQPACESHDIGQPCARCDSGTRDGFETDVDCGGPCDGCANGKACERGSDCTSGYCDTTTSTCAAAAGTTTTTTRTQTDERVVQDLTFPCEELICVATEGKPGYCSRKCRNDSGCPEGFVCKEMQPISGQPFNGEHYCVWKSCRQRSDCGATEDFCCREVTGVDPAEEINLCEFSNDGKCG